MDGFPLADDRPDDGGVAVTSLPSAVFFASEVDFFGGDAKMGVNPMLTTDDADSAFPTQTGALVRALKSYTSMRPSMVPAAKMTPSA